MSDHDRVDDQAKPSGAEPAWKKRQRLAAIFGDVLPDQTRDERGDGESAPRSEGAGDAWLRAQVPPHHGHVPGT